MRKLKIGKRGEGEAVVVMNATSGFFTAAETKKLKKRKGWGVETSGKHQGRDMGRAIVPGDSLVG